MVNAVNAEGETPLHKAMTALFPARHNRDGRLHLSTSEERIEAHDEILEILQEAGGSMDRPNAAGKTPRQFLEETREQWRKNEEERRIWDIPGQR
jgi:FAD/FMN-containing dehydrogenase